MVLSLAALFFCVGVVYDRLHTRDIDAYGGVADTMPRYAAWFMFMMLASVGLPGTSLVKCWCWLALGRRAMGSNLLCNWFDFGACYMLWLYRRVVFGRAVKRAVLNMPRLEGQRNIYLCAINDFGDLVRCLSVVIN